MQIFVISDVTIGCDKVFGDPNTTELIYMIFLI